MKRLVLIFHLLLLPTTAMAWNLPDHRQLSEQSLVEVEKEWKLDVPCEVRPLDSLLEKIKTLRPELGDSWQFSNYLRINPRIDLSKRDSYLLPKIDLENKKSITPLEILTYYSTDPDDGRDQDLFARDAQGAPQAIYPDQPWFGPVTGPSSQAFRHIEKPPFSLSHPLDTFGIPFRKLGESSERAEIYFQLSKLAFTLDEEYWGWRFLAHAFHYIEDLHNPYHAGQITPILMKKGFAAFYHWGFRQKGFKGIIDTFAHVVGNSHRFFESYVATPHPDYLALKENAVEAIKGKDMIPFPGSAEKLAQLCRDRSNRLYAQLTRDVSEIGIDALDSDQEFHSDENKQDDPLLFLKSDPGFDGANRSLFEIVRLSFQSTGEALRSITEQIVLFKNNRSQPDPKEMLNQLDLLLKPALDGQPES